MTEILEWKHYSPCVSDKTKNFMIERNALRELATTAGDKETEKLKSSLRRKVKRSRKLLLKTQISITRRILGKYGLVISLGYS